MHILLVEDDTDHAALILRCLRAPGPEPSVVDHVIHGQRALDALDDRLEAGQPLPDLVLLDLNLPQMTGHELLAVLKSRPETRHVPAVVLSTSDSPADRAKAYALHANAYLVKAADFGRMASMLHSLRDFWGRWSTPRPPEHNGSWPGGKVR